VPGTNHQGLNPAIGDYCYTVTPRYFDAKQSMQPLDGSLSLSVTIRLGPFKKGSLALGFTRGYMQSEAFAHHAWVHLLGNGSPLVSSSAWAYLRRLPPSRQLRLRTQVRGFPSAIGGSNESGPHRARRGPPSHGASLHYGRTGGRRRWSSQSARPYRRRSRAGEESGGLRWSIAAGEE
jgi:hypothetical protein